MLDSVFDGFGGWTGLTGRESDILKIVYRLQAGGGDTSPESIVGEFKRVFRTPIRKPNLFHILKNLREKGYLVHEGYGSYRIDADGLNQALAERQQMLQEKEGELAGFRKDLEGSLRRLSYGLTPPKVDYLEYHDFWKRMGEMSRETDKLSLVASFPQIAYTRTVYRTLGREKYMEPLYREATRKKGVRLEYLTDLDVDFLFNHCFRSLEDPRKAYRETVRILDTLENLVEKQPNIDVRHLPDPHGLDVAIRHKEEEPIEFMLFIKDEHQDLMAGILIKNPAIAKNSHQMFTRGYEYATPLTSRQGREILGETRENLEKKYGILGV